MQQVKHSYSVIYFSAYLLISAVILLDSITKCDDDELMIMTFNSQEKYVNFVFGLKISCNAKIEGKVSTFLAMHSKARRL